MPIDFPKPAPFVSVHRLRRHQIHLCTVQCLCVGGIGYPSARTTIEYLYDMYISAQYTGLWVTLWLI